MSIDELKDLTEKELNKALWEATEQRYGWLIKLIKEESTRRVREA